VSDGLYQFIAVDLPPLLAATLASFTCGLIGSLLVLRRQAMLGDAISHAVLPGLVIAFLVTGTRSPVAMFIGAAVAGLVTVLITALIRRLARVEPGAAMGVVFSVMFALGVLLISRAARQVDLDADCVLNGQLETLFWFPPRDTAQLLTLATLATLRDLPVQVFTLAAAATISILAVSIFWKEIRVASFDPGLAAALGMRPSIVGTGLMVLVAIATVASFEAVGSILVIAMLVCPGAAARMLTDRMGSHVVLSAAIGALCGVVGYVAGAWGPGWLGASSSVSIAGSIAVVSGLVLGVAAIVAPRHGLLARLVRRVRLASTIAAEDALGLLYRAIERDELGLDARALAATIGPRIPASLGLRSLRARGLVTVSGGIFELTPAGRAEAAAIIRSHRLWETFLVREAGFRPDHVHNTATRLEHVRDTAGAARLAPSSEGVSADPHERPIPPVRD
jgi:manganese/zinc/iron transport system permease protein